MEVPPAFTEVVAEPSRNTDFVDWLRVLGAETASAVVNIRDSAAGAFACSSCSYSYSLFLEYLFNSAISADAAAGAFEFPMTISLFVCSPPP